MIQEIRKPDSRTFYKFSSTDGLTVHEGYTDIDQVTQSGLANKEASINPAIIYPALPSSGWIEENISYSYNGDMLRVVQSHNRTHFEPSLTPNLFDITRPNTEGMGWVKNEKVEIGDKRDWEGKTYRAIQGQTTREGQTPDITPALWVIWNNPEVIAAWVQPGSTNPYMKGNKVLFNGDTYESIIDNNVWSPSAYPGGWEKI